MIGKFTESCIIKGCQECLTCHCWLDLIATPIASSTSVNCWQHAWHFCSWKGKTLEEDNEQEKPSEPTVSQAAGAGSGSAAYGYGWRV